MRLVWKAVAAAGLWFFLESGAVQAADFESSSGAGPTVSLTRVVMQLPAGVQWHVIQQGVFCIPFRSEKSDGSLNSFDLNVLGPAFSRNFANSNAAVANQSINLFGGTKNPTAADLQVGAIIRSLQLKTCVMGVLGAKIDANISVEWQVYSPGEGRVVATMTTSGAANQKTVQLQTAEAETIRLAFEESVRQLAASPEMKAALQKTTLGRSEAPANPTEAGHLSLQVAAQGPRAIADEVGSVVVVALGDATGSGVLISPDGYILTNEHVVGRAKSVRIRWSDGFESAGEVVRTHAKRDVALIKADPHGRDALPLRFGALQPGDTVFAIGEPLGFQNTVTRGVVSAPNRIVDGFRFIQSDVIVNHGNSGGPLLDEKGQVIGLTDISLQMTENSPIGLNFFIPIKDAVDFLNLDLTSPPAEPPPIQNASEPAAKSPSAKRQHQPATR